MKKIKKQIEAQLQEIIFFSSLFIGFTMFINGILHLTLSSESLENFLGNFGATLNNGLFTFLGYGFFYLTVLTLHMGYILNIHVFKFSDFKKHSSVLLYSLLSHAIILVLFSNLLAVIQLSLEITSSASLSYGAGGMLGHLLSSALYANLGVFGSLLLVSTLMAATSILGGFFELPDVIRTIKKASKSTQRGFQQIAKKHEMTEVLATVSGQSRMWLSNSISKANEIVSEHFQKEEATGEKAVKLELVKEKPVKNTAKHSAKKAEQTITLVRTNIPKKMSLTEVSEKIAKQKQPRGSAKATEAYIKKTVAKAKAVKTVKMAMSEKTMLTKKATAVAILAKVKEAKSAEKSKAKKK